MVLAQRLSQALFISKFSRICVNESTCQKPRVSTHTRLCHRWEQRSPRISKEREKAKGLESTTHTYLYLLYLKKGNGNAKFWKRFVIVSNSALAFTWRNSRGAEHKNVKALKKEQQLSSFVCENEVCKIHACEKWNRWPKAHYYYLQLNNERLTLLYYNNYGLLPKLYNSLLTLDIQ